MKIQCDNGLCDRLAFTFSYLMKSRLDNDDLVVCWILNTECNGHFLDYFHPVHDITLTNDLSNNDVFGHRPCGEFDPRQVFIYEDLKVIPKIEKSINKLRSELNDDYIAIHVRRSDRVFFKRNSGPLTSDPHFYRFIESFDDGRKIFLATDNCHTQGFFKKRYGKRIVCSSKIMPTSHSFRQTSLEIAVIDLFTCIEAAKFEGTSESGFTRFIEQFRKRQLGKRLKFL